MCIEFSVNGKPGHDFLIEVVFHTITENKRYEPHNLAFATSVAWQSGCRVKFDGYIYVGNPWTLQSGVKEQVTSLTVILREVYMSCGGNCMVLCVSDNCVTVMIVCTFWGWSNNCSHQTSFDLNGHTTHPYIPLMQLLVVSQLVFVWVVSLLTHAYVPIHCCTHVCSCFGWDVTTCFMFPWRPKHFNCVTQAASDPMPNQLELRLGRVNHMKWVSYIMATGCIGDTPIHPGWGHTQALAHK